jgi:hypothetical protein
MDGIRESDELHRHCVSRGTGLHDDYDVLCYRRFDEWSDLFHKCEGFEFEWDL